MRILSALSFAIPIFLQVAVLALLVKKGIQRRFRWFFIYLLYEIFEEISRLIVSDNKHAYFVVYWATSALAVLFTFLAIRESFLHVLGAFVRLDWFRRLLWICIGLAAAYSLAKALFQPWIQGPLFVALILHGEQTFEYLVCAAALFYLAAVHWYKIRKYQWEYRVILGFLVNAALSNFGVLTRSIFGTRFVEVSSWLPAVAYIAGALVWLLSFSRPEPEIPDPQRPPIDLTPQEIMADLERHQKFPAKVRAFLRRR